MKITFKTTRNLKNFTDRTVNFSIRARKICAYMISLTVEKRYQLLNRIDALMDLGKMLPVDCANIRLFCYDDLYSLYLA